MRLPFLITIALIGLAAAVLAQAPSNILRLGDIARQLTDQDVAELQRALPSGEKPWILIGEPGRAAGQNVAAFLPPKTASNELRRGDAIVVRRESNASKWIALDRIDYDEQIGHSTSYAQVMLPDRSFDQMQGDQDLNRPFFVTGEFKDSELISLAKYIRSRPVKPNTRGVAISAGPIVSVVRKPDTTVHVWVREKATAWQWLVLQQGHTWSILNVSQVSD
jgi:hypothetical protein